MFFPPRAAPQLLEITIMGKGKQKWTGKAVAFLKPPSSGNTGIKNLEPIPFNKRAS
jgi:hypothetical protein